jgi:hypothetical protein
MLASSQYKEGQYQVVREHIREICVRTMLLKAHTCHDEEKTFVWELCEKREAKVWEDVVQEGWVRHRYCKSPRQQCFGGVILGEWNVA